MLNLLRSIVSSGMEHAIEVKNFNKFASLKSLAFVSQNKYLKLRKRCLIVDGGMNQFKRTITENRSN